MRRYQVATAAVITVLAAVAMYDTRRGALPDIAATSSGLGAGFYPFWAAALVFAAGAAVALRAARVPPSGDRVFADRKAVVSVLTLAVPMIVAVSLIKWTGIYLMTGLYIGGFMAFIGRSRWWWSLAAAIVLPAAIYAAFELGFRVTLPKSIFYDWVRF